MAFYIQSPIPYGALMIEVWADGFWADTETFLSRKGIQNIYRDCQNIITRSSKWTRLPLGNECNLQVTYVCVCGPRSQEKTRFIKEGVGIVVLQIVQRVEGELC